MNLRRKGVQIGILLTALLGLNLWGYGFLAASKTRAAHAAQNADLCQQLAARIIALKSEPAIAGTREQAQQELSRRIESVARSAGVTGDNLAAIDPDAAVRAADTAYLEKPTTVQLREITLPQLAEIICKLSGDGTGLRIKSLRLTAPPGQQNDDLWSAELTVTYLIYAPLPVQHTGSERS